MFIFGHIGITLGIFYLLSRLSSKNNLWVNVPWIAIVALLPDFIDKSLGRIILAETIGNGRIFAHTLLFFLLLSIAGYYLSNQGKPELLIIAGASFCHLLEDQMWSMPKVLFWPFLGWGFPKDTISGNFIEYLWIIFNRSYTAGFTDTFLSEIIGLFIIILFTGNVLKNRDKRVLQCNNKRTRSFSGNSFIEKKRM
jgi:membrane-bound metal-dependent hydrolase YbcI (DUF457 family)